MKKQGRRHNVQSGDNDNSRRQPAGGGGGADGGLFYKGDSDVYTHTATVSYRRGTVRAVVGYCDKYSRCGGMPDGVVVCRQIFPYGQAVPFYAEIPGTGGGGQFRGEKFLFLFLYHQNYRGDTL